MAKSSGKSATRAARRTSLIASEASSSRRTATGTSTATSKQAEADSRARTEGTEGITSTRCIWSVRRRWGRSIRGWSITEFQQGVGATRRTGYRGGIYVLKDVERHRRSRRGRCGGLERGPVSAPGPEVQNQRSHLQHQGSG